MARWREDHVAELDALCYSVEVRHCVIRALNAITGSRVDIEDEWKYLDFSDEMDELDKQAVAVVNALAEGGHLAHPCMITEDD